MAAQFSIGVFVVDAADHDFVFPFQLAQGARDLGDADDGAVSQTVFVSALSVDVFMRLSGKYDERLFLYPIQCGEGDKIRGVRACLLYTSRCV